MSSSFAENDCLASNTGDAAETSSHAAPAAEKPNSLCKGSALQREDSYSDQDFEPDSPSWMTGLRHRARLCK